MAEDGDRQFLQRNLVLNLSKAFVQQCISLGLIEIINRFVMLRRAASPLGFALAMIFSRGFYAAESSSFSLRFVRRAVRVKTAPAVPLSAAPRQLIRLRPFCSKTALPCLRSAALFLLYVFAFARERSTFCRLSFPANCQGRSGRGRHETAERCEERFTDAADHISQRPMPVPVSPASRRLSYAHRFPESADRGLPHGLPHGLPRDLLHGPPRGLLLSLPYREPSLSCTPTSCLRWTSPH